MSDAGRDELDRQDMQRLAAGHDSALNDLMERHAQRLFHYLLRHLPDASDAEDCAQEAFVRVYVHRVKFKPRAKFSTWLYAIATNLAHDRQRRHSRHPEVLMPPTGQDDGGLESVPDKTALPSEKMQEDERAAQVRAAVHALPEELRAPLVLFEYEELSHAEIAEILDCTPKAVELRLYRARATLRKSLTGVYARG